VEVVVEEEKDVEVDDHGLCCGKKNPSNRSLGDIDLFHHVLMGLLLVHVLGQNNLLPLELHGLFSNSFLFLFCVHIQYWPRLEDQICAADQKKSG
jgi:hypothetical protein